ncbi:MAG: CotH kinase family protein [Peptoniphilaceae bacterium]
MIESKKINIIVTLALSLSLLISIVFVVIGNKQNTDAMLKTELEYETEIFGEDIISIEIISDEKDWQEMLENAINEQYIMVDVIVNGTKFQNVGIRSKGNSSLTQVVNSESDRYSFKLKFDEYIKGQTCFGLESFVVNNMMTDTTYMKEYVSYELMEEIGVDAPKFGYTDIKVNGEDWGLYLAVESYNKSYEQRVFSDTSGMLYNVKNTEKVKQKGENQTINKQDDLRGDQAENIPPKPKNNINITNDVVDNRFRPQMNIGKDEESSSGGSLEYTDNNIESYPSIFENVVGEGTKSDFQNVIEAIDALSKGKELETYYDIDQILRYLAAHTLVVNLDSYSSSMAQNYYIYENEGKLTILPWDYNQAWGGFQNNSASSVVNFPIDTPLSDVEMSSRPLIEKLFENTEYLERYHSYLQELLDSYFSNGKFEEKINELDSLISNYVKNDATAFSTYEEYKAALPTFIKLGNLRAESIQRQLDGTIPSTTEEQNESADSLIPTVDLNISLLTSSMLGKAQEGGNPPRNIRNLDTRGNQTQKKNFIPNNQDKISENRSNLNLSAEQKVDNKKNISIGVSMLVLIFGLLFAWKFENKY